MTISRLNDIRTDVGEGVCRSAGAVVGEARELIAVDRAEVAQDGILANTVVGTKPGGVSGRTARGALNGSECAAGIILGISNGSV